jgi:hypothetical protein
MNLVFNIAWIATSVSEGTLGLAEQRLRTVGIQTAKLDLNRLRSYCFDWIKTQRYTYPRTVISIPSDDAHLKSEEALGTIAGSLQLCEAHFRAV